MTDVVLPVELPWMPRSGLPPWPAVAEPQAQVAQAVAWIAAQTPAVVTVLQEAWSTVTAARAADLARAGQRVLWCLPPETALDSAILADLAVAGIPLKLVLPVTSLPPLVPGWWVVLSGDAGEVSAALAQHLRDEFPVLIAVAPPVTAGPSWPREQAWEPGQGRWLRRGDGPVLTCTASEATAALATAHPVFQRTSLAPCPSP
jgi:hypothetical protein